MSHPMNDMQTMSHESSGLCWCGPNNHGPEKHRPIVHEKQIRCAACDYAMHRITRPDGTSTDTALLDLFATNHTEPATSPQQAYPRLVAGQDISAGAPLRIEDTCCGQCINGTCYVDQVTGA